jgi:hypothetical protein
MKIDVQIAVMLKISGDALVRNLNTLNGSKIKKNEIAAYRILAALRSNSAVFCLIWRA